MKRREFITLLGVKQGTVKQDRLRGEYRLARRRVSSCAADVHRSRST